jgi:hypothetical protein
MPTTHTHKFSTTLLGSLHVHTQDNWPFQGPNVVTLLLSPLGSCRFSGKSMGTDTFASKAPSISIQSHVFKSHTFFCSPGSFWTTWHYIVEDTIIHNHLQVPSLYNNSER